MATKRAIVEQLTRDELWELVDTYDLKVEDRRKLDELHSVALRLHRTDLRDFLSCMDRVRLKAICRRLDLDDGGKLKTEIADRILGHNGDESGSDSPRGSRLRTRVLNELSREDLHRLADRLHVELSDRRSRESAIETLLKVSKNDLGSAFRLLSRDTLKRTCRSLEIDDAGTKKQELIERIFRIKLTDEDEDASKPARKPRLFIGSTVEALAVAREVQAELEHEAETTIWSQDLFTAGATTWSDLVKKSQWFDFALIVFSGDDTVLSRGSSSSAPRDNVLLEYGLFVGTLGSERTFFLYDRNHKPKLATDLAGVTALTYDGERTDKNLQAAVGPACTRLRKLFKEHGNRGR